MDKGCWVALFTARAIDVKKELGMCTGNEDRWQRKLKAIEVYNGNVWRFAVPQMMQFLHERKMAVEV
jgi:hypothetical protein